MELTATMVRDELVERCKLGDTAGYETLYRQYAKAMYNTSLRIVNNTADAEDVLQEAFLDAFRSLNDFHYHSTFGAWLKRIVINKSINILRKRKMNLVELDQTNAHALMKRKRLDEQELQYKVEQVKKAIEKLADGYRTVTEFVLARRIRPGRDIGNTWHHT